MKKLNYSNFELIKDIIEDIDFDRLKCGCEKLEKIKTLWNEIIGNKISKFAKVYKISDDNVLMVTCADSLAASELYVSKEKIMELINEKTSETGIIIKDMIFDYRKWKE